MCQTVLTKADMKAIASARGFDKQCLLSGDKFEKYFHSVIGLDHVFNTLSPDEQVFLHYMGNAWVDVKFFAPLYKKASEENARRHETFTQRYSETYKIVLDKLIRKGVLVVRESYGDSKLERWRFQVFELFSTLLTSPFIKTFQFDAEATVDDSLLRHKIAGCITTKATKKFLDIVHIDGGELRFGEGKLSTAALQSWQYKKWYSESISEMKSFFFDGSFEQLFKKQVIGAFERLAKNTWVKPASLKALLKFITYPGEPLNHDKVIEVGYALGCLKKATRDGESYYTPSHLFDENTLDPGVYLEASNDGFIINIQKIPFHNLAQLTRFGHFDVLKKNLYIHFKFTALTKMDTDFIQSPLLHWMRQQLPLLENQVNQIELKHGKIILHKNLLIAKMNDLRLKAHLMKAYHGVKEVIFLPNDYLVLPRAMKPELERLIKKAGYAIRTQ